MTSYYIKIDSPIPLEQKEPIKLCIEGDDNVYEVQAARVYPNDRVRIKLSEEEKQERRRLYRINYRNQPHIKKKLEEMRNDPIRKKRRQEYARREDVKRRKRETSKKRRLLLREYINTFPQYEKKLRQKVSEKLDRNDENSTSDTEPNSQ